MRNALLLLIALGCAPPDPITVNGSAGVEIRLLYPEPDVELTLDPDGMLRTLVVVDLIGIEFVSPGAGAELDPSQGHYHLFVQETEYVGAPASTSFELESDAFKAGQRGIINVDIRDNEHEPYDGVCDCTASVEFNVVAAE